MTTNDKPGPARAWIYTDEAARRAEVCSMTIRRWAVSGIVRAWKVGHAWRVDPTSLDALVNPPAAGADRGPAA